MEIVVKLFSELKEKNIEKSISDCEFRKEEEGIYKLITGRRVSVKEILDAFSIKGEVMALVNGREVGINYMLIDKDDVSLFPFSTKDDK